MVKTIFAAMLGVLVGMLVSDFRSTMSGSSEPSEVVQLTQQVSDLQSELAARPVAEQIGEIEFQYEGKTLRMAEYVPDNDTYTDGTPVNWPSIACVNIAGKRGFAKDRNIMLGGQQLFIKDIDSK